MSVDINIDRRLIGGSVLLMTGGALACLAGAALGTVVVVSACRQYLADLQEPPQDMVRRRLGQARSATMAGVGAWQEFGRQPRA